MNTIIRNKYLSAEDKNRLYTEGYRYYCQTNIHFPNEQDENYPFLQYDYFLTDNRKEARVHALTQTDPYYGGHPIVKKIKVKC